MVVTLHKDAHHALDDMKCFIADADEEKKALESIVSRFAASGEGNACVVVGRGESGRTTVVKNAIDEFELSAKLLIVSVAQLGSEKNTLQMLTNDKDVKNFITHGEREFDLGYMARIVFQPASTLDEYVKVFGKFLGKENSKTSKDATIHTPVAVEGASAFLCLYLANESGQPSAELLTEAVDMILPRKDSLETIVRNVSKFVLEK
ncbi:hypothetical protein COOONC_03824, partial [Cooperia oncophora]